MKEKEDTYFHPQTLTKPSQPPVANLLACTIPWLAPFSPPPPSVRLPIPTAGAQVNDVTPNAWAGKSEASHVPSSIDLVN